MRRNVALMCALVVVASSFVGCVVGPTGPEEVAVVDESSRPRGSVLILVDYDAPPPPDAVETGSADQVTISYPDAAPITATNDAGNPCYWGTSVNPSGGTDPAWMCSTEITCAQTSGCFIIGAHGGPDGQVTCLPPPGTVPSGSTCVLSVCYGGSNGAAQCVAMQQGLDAGGVIGCTGVVYVDPNSGLRCSGYWVDGNGNVLGDGNLTTLFPEGGAPAADGAPSAPVVYDAGISWCNGEGC